MLETTVVPSRDRLTASPDPSRRPVAHGIVGGVAPAVAADVDEPTRAADVELDRAGSSAALARASPLTEIPG